jgi:hypothetical protein
MVAAMAVVRAQEFIDSMPEKDEYKGSSTSPSMREQEFSGANGQIVGYPDVVRSQEVVDFKTGGLFEDDDQEQVKAAYVRQLRLYGYLVKESLGWWPERGVLLPMTGTPVEVNLTPDECAAEAEAVVELLNEYNGGLAQAAEPADLARPSAVNCRWCQHQLYCPAFWRAVEPGWTDELRSSAVVGRATGPAIQIHGGSALSLQLDVEHGTAVPAEPISLFPLDSAVHTSVPLIQAGDRVHVTGLWCRADHSLVAREQTMIAVEGELVTIQIASPDPLGAS